MEHEFDPLTLAYHELRSSLGLVVMQARAVAGETGEPETRRRCEAIAALAEQLVRTSSVLLRSEELAGAP
ncbi:MAG: hypothetical protein IT429_17360, partial [Gemmataceae bacterium]|nr:hypothetical protein [Gemmataceae bacterium]